MSKYFSISCIAALTLAACDQDAAFSDDASFALEEADYAPEEDLVLEDSDLVPQEVVLDEADLEDPWEGLSIDERAALEDERGVDQVDGHGDLPLASATPVSAAAAPGCVYLYQWGSYHKSAQAVNRCSYAVRLKMIWRFGYDTECRTLNPGQVWTDTDKGFLTYVTELRRC